MRILLAIDDSNVSLAAVKELLRRPWPEGTTVRVITVEPLTYPAHALGFPDVGISPVMVGLYNESEQELRDEAAAMVAALANQLTQAGIDAEGIVRRGDAADAIVAEAGDWNADLILMGSHGRTGLKRALMGSVAQKVVSHAPCSVEVVRDHEELQDTHA